MPKISSKAVLLSILGIFIILIFYKFLTLLSFPDSQIVLQKGELIPLQPKASLSQTFIANRDNLMKIEFLVRTPGIKPGDAVSVELKDASCANTVRKGTLNPAFLNSDNLYEFQFAKIPDSNGKTYCIVPTFKSPKVNSKGILLFSQDQPNGQLQLKNTATGESFAGKTLSIRPAYVNDNLWQNVTELNQRISQYKPWFLKHFYLSAIAILFVVLSIGLITLLILI